MARLESVAKGGFYPTPPEVTKGIAERCTTNMSRNDVVRLLDPCCGEGVALNTLKETLQQKRRHAYGGIIETYGIELNANRTAESRKVLDHVIGGDIGNTRISNNQFNCLWLNPPYGLEQDMNGKNDRQETYFLRRCTNYLQHFGLLIYIIPRTTLAKNARFLAANYEDTKVFWFPGGGDRNINGFDQIVVFGQKKTYPQLDKSEETKLRYLSSFPPPWDELSELEFDFPIRYAYDPNTRLEFTQMFFDKRTTLDAARTSSPLHTKEVFYTPKTLRPAPLRDLTYGHTALFTIAGFLDNMVVSDDDGNRSLIKGTSLKEEVVIQDDESKHVSVEVMKTSIQVLNLRKRTAELGGLQTAETINV